VTPPEAVRATAHELEAAGVPTARVDAELLVAHVLGKTRSELYLPDGHVSDADLRRLRALVARRRTREPLAYVLGEWGFRNLTLAVDPRVLIPRPETEVVVERCLACLRGLEAPRVLDVGTGSGAIALALADERPDARVCATDLSDGALAVARANAARAGLVVDFVRADLFAGVRGPYDLVVSNPPYVDPGEVDALEPEVRDWEPRGAFVGRDLFARIAEGAREVVRSRGWLVLECGDGQAADVKALLEAAGYVDVAVTRDLGGTERVVEARKP
jgi:release factor glutamine methyltransferase